MFKPLTMVWLATKKNEISNWVSSIRWLDLPSSCRGLEMSCCLRVDGSFPIERSPQYRPKTCWRNYVFHLTWERLWIHKEEPENAAGDTDVWNTILSFDLTLNKRQWMYGIKTTLKVTHSLGYFLIFAPLFSPVIETYLPSHRTLRSIRW